MWVRVSTRIISPRSRYSGTWTVKPVDNVAGFVRAVAEAPFMEGPVSVISSSTTSGSSSPIMRPLCRSARIPSRSSVRQRRSSLMSSTLIEISL